MINSEKQDINVKRKGPSKKRSRDGLRSHLTPSRKRGGSLGGQGPPGSTGKGGHGPQGPPGLQRPPDSTGKGEQHTTSTEYCSDSEDLFGDYDDSILGDRSLLAKLDHAEQNARQTDPGGGGASSAAVPDRPPHFTALRPPDAAASPTPSCDEELSESLLAGFRDSFRDSFRDVPATQQDFQEEVVRHAKRNDDCMAGDKTSTPCRVPEVTAAPQTGKRRSERVPKARRSMADLLKRTMLGNAAGPSNPPRSAALKEAVLTEQMGVAMQAMETVSAETPDRGPFFGLPTKVKELVFSLKGIKDLYDWQKTCLNLQCVQERRNLIYSLPTSGGKTLVAEILILRELLCRKKDCVFILPYVSLVQEKVRGLATMGLELDFLVEEYAGSKGRFPPVKRRQRNCLYVCTIEKGHSLVNSLIETSRLDHVGLVVVDELHMLGDGSRGAIIEMTLAKVLYVSKTTQVIGMSATLGNVKDLQTFLRAENFDNDFRPVQLQEYVKLRDSIYEVDPREEDGIRLSRFLNFKYSSNMQKMDPDHIVALVTEVIPAHSCLIFCPTKKNCENVALMICKYLTEVFVVRQKEKKDVLLRALKDSGNGCVCPVLRKTVPYGLAYHHSGLTTEERKLIEEAYSDGVLCLLACTSTLAAGINLPARRVILRSPYVATDFLKRSQYKQMVGRAGRAGIDTMGESILILQEKDRSMAKNLLCSPMENCFSNLMYDNGKGLLSLILSLIGLKISSSLEEVRAFLSSTLLSVQEKQLCVDRSLQDVADQAVELLKDKGLVTVSSETHGRLQVTKLGRATYKGSVDLSYCDILYKDLSKGLEGLLLDSFLHLLYLVTPYDMIHHCKPDWMMFLRQFTVLSAAEQRMCAAVGVPESLITRKAAGQTTKKSVNMEVVHRLYLALVLFSLLKDTDLWSVAERFQLSRGFLQTLLSSSSAFCSCVLHFTEELEELWPFKALLVELTRRLTYCVQADLIPLMEVAGVMESRAKQLYNAGFKTLSHLANADPGALADSVENLYQKQAKQIVASAKMLLSEKAAALQEEMDDLLMIPPDEAFL